MRVGDTEFNDTLKAILTLLLQPGSSGFHHLLITGPCTGQDGNDGRHLWHAGASWYLPAIHSYRKLYRSGCWHARILFPTSLPSILPLLGLPSRWAVCLTYYIRCHWSSSCIERSYANDNKFDSGLL